MIEYWGDGVFGPELSSATRRAVAQAAIHGRTEETIDGWPYLSLAGRANEPLDAPLGYEALEQLADERDSAIVVFGLGLGHAIRAIRGAGARIAFVFEPDPGIVRQYLEDGPMDLGGIHIITELAELADEWSGLVGSASRVHMIDTPGYQRAFPEARRALAQLITRMLEKNVVNDATFRARGRAWISDIIDNAPFIATAPSALHLQGAFRGVPAFIVGAGPSLAKNVELLGEAAKKGLVFATNTSARALDQAGVAPQFLGCIESLDLSRFFEGLSFLERSIRLLSFTSHPRHFTVDGGPILNVHELLPQVSGPFDRLYGRSALPVCGSVSTALLALAVRLGCSPIVLVGQDLAFPGGQAYSAGTAFAGSRVQVSADGTSLVHERCAAKASAEFAARSGPLTERLEWALGWGEGESVPSTVAFGHIRTWLERFASVLSRAEAPPELLNATEGGSHVAGFEDQRLSDVLADLPAQEITPESIFALAKSKGPHLEVSDAAAFLVQQARGARLVARAARELEAAGSMARGSWNVKSPEETLSQMRGLDAAEAALRERLGEFPWADVWAWAELDRTAPARGSTQVLSGIERETRRGAIVGRAAEELAGLLEARARTL